MIQSYSVYFGIDWVAEVGDDAVHSESKERLIACPVVMAGLGFSEVMSIMLPGNASE